MEPGYIYYGQYTGFSFTSWFIRAFTWSRRSHTSCFRPPINGEFGNVIEAWKGGVTETHWTENHKPGTKIDVYMVPCSTVQASTFYRHMALKKGSKYDFLGVVGFAFRANIEKRNRWFCSEAVFDSALRAGIVLLKNIKPYKVFPALLDLPPQASLVAHLIVPEKNHV